MVRARPTCLKQSRSCPPVAACAVLCSLMLRVSARQTGLQSTQHLKHQMVRWTLGTGTFGDMPGGETARRLRINGAPQKSNDVLTEHLRVVWITPQMDGLFSGPAADRRRFIDRLVLAIDPSHGQRSLDFERAMKSRNRLFEDGRRDGRWLTPLKPNLPKSEPQLPPPGSKS